MQREEGFERHLLAEKIETRKEFEDAKDIGYSLFQGYFFKKPEILEGNSIPVYPNNYFKVIKELNKNNPDFNKVSDTIKSDMSLSYKLLKVINSAAYGIRSEVKSIKQALVLLGIEEIKKWFHLMVIKDIAHDEPKEIMRISLVRAKTAEKIA
jgi:EAL and modified HD-GYP domain-containing signal transduction protein